MREAQISIGDGDVAAMGIEELVSLAEAAGLRDMDELACYGDSAVVQFAVETRLAEHRLDDLTYVGEWEGPLETENGHVYVVAFTAPGLSPAVADAANELVGTCEPERTADGYRMSLTGSQAAISDAVSEYESDDVTPTLERLGGFQAAERHLDALTDRQREVLRTAFEMGYYDVPRDASTDDVAAELGVDPSTVTEHLQRAERNLLASVFSAE